ncbi:hypothetical protein AZZ66_004797, partial [Escherichia coli]
RLAMVLTGPEPAAATAPGNLRRKMYEYDSCCFSPRHNRRVISPLASCARRLQRTGADVPVLLLYRHAGRCIRRVS